ncbi:MAG: hypothetical protein Q4F76_12855, partial [Lachnospiraceae bacterium]|nr:hypothetical protein [Lachnospiraceae bacterium]
IVMEMDVSGLGQGSHRGVLTFEGLQDGFEVVNYSDFRVLVSPKEYGPGGLSSETESSQENSESFPQQDDHQTAETFGETAAFESAEVTVHGESVSDGWLLEGNQLGAASEVGAFYSGAAEEFLTEHNTEGAAETEGNSQ